MGVFILLLSAELAVYSVVWVVLFVKRGQPDLVVFGLVPSMASVLLGRFATDTSSAEAMGLDLFLIVLCAIFFCAIPFAVQKLEGRSQ